MSAAQRVNVHARFLGFILTIIPALLTSPAAGDPLALSPVIGVIPTSLQFGILCPGACLELQVSILNAVQDPQSRLVLSKLVVTPPFTLPHPPPIPTIIPGDGTRVDLFLHYCGEGSGPVTGSLTIHANATNSPVVVPLQGTTDSAPRCDAGGPYFGLPNQPITFDGRGSSDPGGAIVTYTWDFGDGSTSTGPTPTHTYSAKGTYVVRLTVADHCGSPTTCQATVIVSNNALPICDAGGPYTGLTGTPIAMSGAGSSDPDGVIVEYRWDFGDGQTATGVKPNHVYSAPGFYTVALAVVDDQGAISNCSTTADVNTQGVPNVPPVCDAGGPYRGVVGRPVTFDATGSSDPDGIVVAYHWDFGDGVTATGATPSHTYVKAGYFTVSLGVTDNDGASSSCSTRARSIDVSPDLNSTGQHGRSSNSAGLNPYVTLPLHTIPGSQDCTAATTIDCILTQPTVDIAPDAIHTIFLLANNYSALAGVQTAFGWDAGWSLLEAHFDCMPGQVATVVPASPGGATAGTVSTTFNCVNTGQLLVIGRLIVRSGKTDCFYQVESDRPYGDHVIDCSLGIDKIRDSQSRLGRICVAQGGIDACHVIDPQPVQPTTWGQIKATYR